MCDYVNSKQVQFTKSPATCGLVEMHHLPEGMPDKIAIALANHFYHKANPRPSAFALWSDIRDGERQSRGEALAEFFSRNEHLGRLIATPKEMNPRTGNVITVWVIKPNHEEFRKWYTEQVMHRLDVE